MNGFDLVKGAGLKDIIAIKIEDEFKDLSFTIPQNINDEKIEFISKSSQDGLDIIRHSTAHLLAAAIKVLFPNTIFTIGPSIENGFYYDIFSEQKISENDFIKIEKEMKNIVDKDVKFVKKAITKEEALKLFKHNKFKCEIIKEIPDNQEISIYELGDYIDLCHGPHVPSTRYLKYFKLTKISGVYWRADATKDQLQRIYGTAWDSAEALESYFNFIAEAERRDHKKICKAMDLCHWEPEYAPGAAFWHPKGWFIWQTLVNWLREVKTKNGYTEAHTPRVMNRVLWEISGHWANYGEHNYGGKTQDEMQFAVKPMNCPGGVLIYNSSPKSYRDLPIRMAEFGEVNRFEASGSLNGLLRCREFTQDDAHVWCTPEQLKKEITDMQEMFYKQIYNVLGFDTTNVKIVLSLRPEKRIGSDEIWDASEKYLEDVLKELKLQYKLAPGEGAFYGPKLEYSFKDAIGRWWQIGTIQLDMNLPQRFNMTYIGEDGKKHNPCMLHAACFGSLDRFLGMYIETVEGKFPLWHNPLIATIINVNNNVNDYCKKIYKQMFNKGLKVELNLDNSPLKNKLAIVAFQKVPYSLVIGEKEKQSNSVSIRIFGHGNKTITMKTNEFIKSVLKKIKNKDLKWEI